MMRLLLRPDRNLTDAPALVPKEAGPRVRDDRLDSRHSAFTRVHSPLKTGVNALNGALCAGMSGGAALDRCSVAGPALAGQTQSRGRNHARVSFRFFYS